MNLLERPQGFLRSSSRRSSESPIAALLGSACLALMMLTTPVTAQQQLGVSTGLPIPRYVSLKSDRVNLREGPSKDHRTAWVFQRAGLPVEITGEFENWRKIRDSEGAEGWVLQSLLSGRRTALVSPWRKEGLMILKVRAGSEDLSARLQPGVIGSVKACDGKWCRIYGEGYDGYIEQIALWGVYPGEKVQ